MFKREVPEQKVNNRKKGEKKVKTCLKEEVSFGQQNKNALSSKEIEVNSGQANTSDKEKEVKYVYKKLMLSCPGPVI